MLTALPIVDAKPDPGPAPYGSSLEHLRDELERIDVLVRGQVQRAQAAAGDEAYRGLAISEREVDALLWRAPGAPPWAASTLAPSLEQAHAVADRMANALTQRCVGATAPLRLAQLAERFGLDRFDLDVLLIALAPEIDLRYERLYAYLHDDVTRKRPSVDLALHLLCRSLDERFAARERFSASAPLVKHGLVQLASEPSTPPLPRLALAIKLDERVVDWLHGSDELEPRLGRHAQRKSPRTQLNELLFDAVLRQRLAGLAAEARSGAAPLLYLRGPYGVGKSTTAEAFAGELGRALLAFDAATLEGKPDDTAEAVVRAVAREARLTGDLLLVEHADLLLETERPLANAAMIELMATLPAPLVLAGEARWEPSEGQRARLYLRIEIGLPGAADQERLWRAALTGAACEPDVALPQLAARFRLSGGQIHDARATAHGLAQLRAGATAPLSMADLSEACRRQSSRHIRALARKVTARPAWEDLVLPADHLARLREICGHARHRALVHESWGFDRKLVNGKGLGLLFAGPPGTGKTLAAAVMAGELGLDLYPIDLSSVVSKWIGETEKHLSRIFDEAERGQAVLFFDEADALFGKRTEVQDAHDRYANLETSYLLQRIEEYEGVVILASNFRRNIDEAFVRRLRFIIDFPLPDERERLRIWERTFPAETPRSEDVDLGYLARRFELAGAYIRNIVLAAAFLAADDGKPVGQRHLLHAARREYQKMGKMIDEAHFRHSGGV